MTLNSIKEKNSSGQFRLTKSGDQCQTFLSQEAFASIWMPRMAFYSASRVARGPGRRSKGGGRQEPACSLSVTFQPPWCWASGTMGF